MEVLQTAQDEWVAGFKRKKNETVVVARSFQGGFLVTHLLACDQQDGSFLRMHHLPENVVENEKFTPAVLQQLHLIIHLVGDT